MALVKYNNNSISAITTPGTLATGAMVLIKSQTASSSSSISFVHGSSDVVLDSTYPIYKFEWINMHPATNDVSFTFNGTSDGSNYNVTKTTTAFSAYHGEGGGGGAIAYDTGRDLAQSTSYQQLMANGGLGNGNDESTSGELFLFSPSSTTFVKHFLAKCNVYDQSDYSINPYIAGYFNTTSAITGIDFKMSSGNIDAGKIKLYGLKDS